MQPHIAHAGTISLSPSRRLTATLRSEHGGGTVLDLRVHVADANRWLETNRGLRVEVDRLPELIDLTERAMQRLPNDHGIAIMRPLHEDG